MKHPNVATLEKIYAGFSEGNPAAILDQCSDKVTFQVPGKSKLAGKYDKSSFGSGLLTQIMELSSGTFKLEAHDMMATDLHGTVLASAKLTRNGKTHELRTVHVWRFEGGKPVAWYEYPRDLYQYDAAWA